VGDQYIEQLEGAGGISPPSEFLQTPPFSKILRGHVWTVPGNMRVKFKVPSFNRFGAICI